MARLAGLFIPVLACHPHTLRAVLFTALLNSTSVLRQPSKPRPVSRIIRAGFGYGRLGPWLGEGAPHPTGRPPRTAGWPRNVPTTRHEEVLVAGLQRLIREVVPGAVERLHRILRAAVLHAAILRHHHVAPASSIIMLRLAACSEGHGSQRARLLRKWQR